MENVCGSATNLRAIFLALFSSIVVPVLFPIVLVSDSTEGVLDARTHDLNTRTAPLEPRGPPDIQSDTEPSFSLVVASSSHFRIMSSFGLSVIRPDVDGFEVSDTCGDLGPFLFADVIY